MRTSRRLSDSPLTIGLWSTLAKGLLSGKYRGDESFADSRAHCPRFQGSSFAARAGGRARIPDVGGLWYDHGPDACGGSFACAVGLTPACVALSPDRGFLCESLACGDRTVTLRALLIGLALVAGLAWITPWNDFALANTYVSGTHFPAGAFCLLVLLTLVVNVGLKFIRRRWALSQQELMLAWCMMTVAATVPSSGLMRYFFPLLATPSHFAQAEPVWQEPGHLLDNVPPQLVLSTEPGAPEAERFYLGATRDEQMVVPWRSWARALAVWGAFLVLFYLAVFFVCSLFRGWWVNAERLTFPVAQVPLDLTDDEAGRAVLPALARSPYFLLGAGASLAAGAWRLWVRGGAFCYPFESLFWGTSLEQGRFGAAFVFPLASGFAFLLPAQISFSFWFFRLAAGLQYVGAYAVNRPIEGGDYGPFMQWQQAGAFVGFGALLLWGARRHLLRVVRKALGAGADVDDSLDPIAYRTAFWGLAASVAGLVFWYWCFGLNPLVALPFLGLTFCMLLVHARLVCQGGLFFTQQNWAPVQIVHSMTGGWGFSAPAIVATMMQHAMLLSDARECLSPHAMNVMRISDVFTARRRRLVPATLAALLLAALVSGWSSMRAYYSVGAYNMPNIYGPRILAPDTFRAAESMIAGTGAPAGTHWGAGLSGVVVMLALLAVRAKVDWWPVHPIGFLVAGTYAMHVMWFSFFLGWLAKVLVVPLGGGRGLRCARRFFVGVICAEAVQVGACALAGFCLNRSISSFVFLPG